MDAFDTIFKTFLKYQRQHRQHKSQYQVLCPSIPATCSLWPVKFRRRRISGDGGQESGGQDAAEEMDLLDTSGHPVKY